MLIYKLQNHALQYLTELVWRLSDCLTCCKLKVETEEEKVIIFFSIVICDPWLMEIAPDDDKQNVRRSPSKIFRIFYYTILSAWVVNILQQPTNQF